MPCVAGGHPSKRWRQTSGPRRRTQAANTRHTAVWQMTDEEVMRSLGNSPRAIDRLRFDPAVAAAPGALKMSDEKVTMMKGKLTDSVQQTSTEVVAASLAYAVSPLKRDLMKQDFLDNINAARTPPPPPPAIMSERGW